jgi:hypothetical protein
MALALQEVDKVAGFEITLALAQGVHRFVAAAHTLTGLLLARGISDVRAFSCPHRFRL